METINSFKGYGKVDPRENEVYRRKARRRVAIVVVSAIVLVAVVVGAVVGVVVKKKSNDAGSQTSPAITLKALCGVTRFPDSCYSSISSLNASNTLDPGTFFKLSLRVVQDSLSKVKDLPQKLAHGVDNDLVNSALDACSVVLDEALDSLNDTVSAMDDHDGKQLLSPSMIDDLKTWLSSVITSQNTCIDSLKEANDTAITDQFEKAMTNSTEFASNSLAIVAQFLSVLSSSGFPIHRKLLGYQRDEGGFPIWMSVGDRRLLQSSNLTPNVTVAADGSGDFKTIKDAAAKIPSKSPSRFIIHIKAGTYNENVDLPKSSWNVMIYGDGIGKTVITGKSSFADGVTTFRTATFSIAGKNFIARDISFVNTAGAANHQAVAFRSGSDMSVYSRCAFDAFQDTLYSHSNRQFYSECQITGTIDFIFGNAAVVFQNCDVLPRQPMANQFNTITAQGKMDPNQNTGISIQNCRIRANGNVTAATYLGRPWKSYSTTVIMQSEIGAVVNSQGWTPWTNGVDPPSTIYYGEYQNTGPGSGVSGRVKWNGYHPSLISNQAAKFTVGSFIDGATWLPSTSVTFSSGL